MLKIEDVQDAVNQFITDDFRVGGEAAGVCGAVRWDEGGDKKTA